MKNYNFFKKIDTELKAYLYGFILGDGCISIREQRKEYCLKVTQNIEDIYIIQLLVDSLNKDTTVIKRENVLFKDLNSDKIYKCKDQAIASFYSKELVTDLIKHGLCKNKTQFELHLPVIEQSLFRHFLRGYFDADGTCGTYLTKKGDSTIKRVKPTFHITSYTISLLEEIHSVLKNTYNINIPVYNTKTRAFVLKSGAFSEIRKLYTFLYTDSTYFLSRKHEKFKNVMLTSSEFRELKNSKPCNA